MQKMNKILNDLNSAINLEDDDDTSKNLTVPFPTRQ